MEPPLEVRRVGRNRVVAIAGGARHALALRADGSVVGWGERGGRLEWEPPPTAGPLVAISAGSGFSVGVRRNGTVVGWGDNQYGQLDVPDGLNRVTTVSCGNYHVLALRDDGTVVAWGNNQWGQVQLPTTLPTTSNVAAIAAGGFHSEILELSGPMITSPRIANGRFACEMNLPAGRRYRLQTSQNLRDWRTLRVDTAVPKRMSWVGAAESRGAAFYRVQPVGPGEPDYFPSYPERISGSK